MTPATNVGADPRVCPNLESKAGSAGLEPCGTLEERLLAFHEAIEAHDFLEIDGDIVGAGSKPALKVLDNDRRATYGVSLETILNYGTQEIIEALERGQPRPLYGITRIVGYYSRISNWNKSKLGELADRHKGNYSVVQGKAHGAVSSR